MFLYFCLHVIDFMCAPSLQGDSSCSNGVQKKMSDPQLFDAEFEKLVSELTEQDFTDPVLSDALNRLREVE